MNAKILQDRIDRLDGACLATMYMQVDALARDVYRASYRAQGPFQRKALQRIDGALLHERAMIQEGLDEDLGYGDCALSKPQVAEKLALTQDVKRRLSEHVEDWAGVLGGAK